jgi:hypothetical protein
MSDHERNEDDSDREDRRYGYRRRTDAEAANSIAVSDFRLSLKEVGFILSVLITVGISLFNFHAQLDKTNAENVLKYELMNTKLSQMQDNIARQEKTVSEIKSQLEDIERLASQIYQKTRDK